MDPQRMWAIGYAQYRPYSTIDTAVEIIQNRRVVLLIKPAVSIKPVRSDASLGNTVLPVLPPSEAAEAKRSSPTNIITPIQLPAIIPGSGAGQ